VFAISQCRSKARWRNKVGSKKPKQHKTAVVATDASNDGDGTEAANSEEQRAAFQAAMKKKVARSEFKSLSPGLCPITNSTIDLLESLLSRKALGA